MQFSHTPTKLSMHQIQKWYSNIEDSFRLYNVDSARLAKHYLVEHEEACVDNAIGQFTASKLKWKNSRHGFTRYHINITQPATQDTPHSTWTGIQLEQGSYFASLTEHFLGQVRDLSVWKGGSGWLNLMTFQLNLNWISTPEQVSVYLL